jgi:hypothetical protein
MAKLWTLFTSIGHLWQMLHTQHSFLPVATLCWGYDAFIVSTNFVYNRSSTETALPQEAEVW